MRINPDNAVILDASAVLAMIFNERGGEKTAARMPNSAISAVNLAEVYAKTIGLDPGDVLQRLQALGAAVFEFSEPEAKLSAELLAAAPKKGLLSLGDRACLALASLLGVSALSADSRWASAGLKVQLEFIR